MNKKVIIIISAVVVLLLGAGGFLLFRNKGIGNGNISINGNNLSEESNKKILSVIGLTDKGYKRTPKEECTICDDTQKEQMDSGNYVLYNDYSLANFFISLEDNKENIIKDLPKEKIKELIYIYAAENDMITVDALIDEGTDDSLLKYPCIEESGICDGVTQVDYSKISNLYGLSENPSDYFTENEKYKQYYLFEPNGSNDVFTEINDEVKTETKDNDIIVSYNIDLKLNNDEKTSVNRKIKYLFKLNDSKNYYLYSVTINK